jgi:hypothetical protein
MRKVFLLMAAAGLGIASLAGGCGSKNKGFSDFGVKPADDDASTGEEEGQPGEDPDFGNNDGGFQVSDAPSDVRYDLDAGCATARAEGKQLPVYIHIILDGSGSMYGPRWNATVDALNNWFDKLATITIAAPDGGTMADNTLGVGMYLFESGEVKPFNSWDQLVSPVTPEHAAAMKTRLLAGTGGGTPLLESVQGQLPLFKNLINYSLAPGGKKVMLVMTDGVPNGGPTAQASLIQIAQQEAAANPPLTTFVVGIGEVSSGTGSYDARFLSTWAKAGGASPAGCDPNWSGGAGTPCHFQITPGVKPATQISLELQAAMDEVRGAAKGCEFTLDKSGGAIDPKKVNVVYIDENGVEQLVTKDPVNGWTYDNDQDPSKVILVGQACSKFKQKARAKVQIVLGCKTAVN